MTAKHPFGAVPITFVAVIGSVPSYPVTAVIVTSTLPTLFRPPP